ncbi:MAG: DUF2628 domain-containing protein [Clostridium sp.]|jgi:hypothetical protein|nr:DUF2628 domain-containing protein [Clostridium sp.]
MPVRYENTPCPGCGKPLAAGEDIVTCPECGAAQHRACWLAQNRCVLSEKHGEGFVWKPEPEQATASPEDKILASHIHRWEEQGEQAPPEQASPEGESFFCPNCGRKNKLGSLQCENCSYLFFAPSSKYPPAPGTRQAWVAEQGDPYYIPPEEDLGGAAAGDLALVVRHNARLYLRKFKLLAQNGKSLVFNFAAFLLGGYWFVYRKLYTAAAIFLGLSLVADLLMNWLLYTTEPGKLFMDSYESLLLALSDGTLNAALMEQAESAVRGTYAIVLPFFGVKLLSGLTAGFIADRLYYKKSVGTVRTLRQIHRSETDFQFAALRLGGGSVMQLVVAYLLIMLIKQLAAKLLLGV